MQLTEEQDAGLETLAQLVQDGRKMGSLTGPAGTGKTTILKTLFEVLGGEDYVAVVTPTNKAAQVLNAKGVPATTLYAKFYIKEEHKDANGRTHLHFVPACDFRGGVPPGKLDHIPVMVVDESSMLQSYRIGQLQKMCDTLILVGDGSQLAPVDDKANPRGYFNSLAHDVSLTKVMRQEFDSPILALAAKIRHSENPLRLPDLNGDAFYPDLDFAELLATEFPQFITFRNYTRRAVNARIRRQLGYTSILPVPGDLMVCSTNYSENLLNGTQVEVVSFSWPGKTRAAEVLLRSKVDGCTYRATADILPFLKDLPGVQSRDLLEGLRGVEELDDGLGLQFGYCVTAHKSQGAEWPSVVVVDERSVIAGVARRERETNPVALTPEEAVRRWIYTATTRAQKNLWVVNEAWTKQ